MKRYRVRAAGGLTWPRTETCLLGISVGQPYHEGEKFRETLRWVSRCFARLHVWVADTLQRHNLLYQYAPGSGMFSPAEAECLSRLAGEEWIARNAGAFSECLTVPCSLSRWDDWLNDPRYPDLRRRLGDLYDASSAFAQAVYTDAERYLASVAQRAQIADPTFATGQCVAYILEECSIIPLVNQDHSGVDVYPGSELQSVRYLRGHPSIPDLATRRFVRIQFDSPRPRRRD
jgi:tRNA-dependent cyclodipeptide synthase